MDVFQGLPSNSLLDIMRISKEISHDLHKSGSSLGAISKRLMVPHSSVRRPTNLIQLHQLFQEEWAKIHPTYCGKLVEGYKNV